MNLVDYVIIGIIGLSVLWGFYRGFIQTILNTGGCLLSLVGSFYLYPSIASSLQNNEELVHSLVYFTDATSRLGDLELSLTKVSDLTQAGIATVLQNVNLPEPLSTLLSYNLENQVYNSPGVQTVAEYINQTVISVSINILCFLACFVLLYIIISVVVNLLRSVFQFPLLKQLDWLLGGIFGALRGLLFCYALFIVVPLVQTVIPLDEITTLINQSVLAQIFNNGNLILSIMNQRL